MSRARRAYASRANGHRSKGPATPEGKARRLHSVRRHGLSLPVLNDSALSAEVEDVARKLAKSVTGAAVDSRRHELACRIAEAIIDLRRVRDAKLPLVADLQSDPTNSAALRELVRLDRYERRAFSRRKLAIREFCAASVAAMGPQQPAEAPAKAGAADDRPRAPAAGVRTSAAGGLAE